MSNTSKTIRRFLWERIPLLRQTALEPARELAEMLRADYSWQADVMQQLSLAIEKGDFVEAKRRFSSGDLWGGAGSVCDVQWPSQETNKRKHRLFIRLVRAFAIAGITYPAATYMASVYKGWIKLP